MDVEGKQVLVLGGAGLVGSAVCRQILLRRPRGLVVSARRQETATAAVERLRAQFAGLDVPIVLAWGDVFLRADWQRDGPVSREAVLADAGRRARLVADILDPLDEDIVTGSWLVRLITGAAPGLAQTPAEIVVDCMNTATAVGYQDLYGVVSRLRELIAHHSADTDWPEPIERLLAALYLPQLVRHVQLLNEAMRRAGTQGYVKVGTSGTGGFGFNIPYTHGEEKPSRLLLAKAALAGAQTLLTFLMARTPGGPEVVKEVKPTALIGWRAIDYGPIRYRGRTLERCDCPPERAVSCRDPANLVVQGDFGVRVGEPLQGVFIDTGENGLYGAEEFVAVTADHQMQMITAEEIAANVVRELEGTNTGRDVIAALDGSVMGPSFHGCRLRQGAIERLRQLEVEHGPSVAYEFLGPPRLSKLLFEAHLLARTCATVGRVFEQPPQALASTLEGEIIASGDLRERILSIGIAILMPDGQRLLRGPLLKARTAEDGWVDLTPDNIDRWRKRFQELAAQLRPSRSGTGSSDHPFAIRGIDWISDDIRPGELAAWILSHEEGGWRVKT
ncbi:MAG: short-chain dehydrogenase [Gammaproteobacteria bacterium]